MRQSDDRLFEAIDEILQRGNDVQIQRKKDGYVVMEVSRVIRMTNISSKNACIPAETVIR